MKIKLNGKEVHEDELDYELEKLTDIKQYYSLAHLQKVWCKCSHCKETQELNTPLSALDFVFIHKRDCGNDIAVSITVSKGTILAW